MALTKVSSHMMTANVVNVKDHGATGDGTTDDTAAIRSAITALPANGSVLYFPPGNYLVAPTGSDATVFEIANKDNISIQGYGAKVFTGNLDLAATSNGCWLFIIKGCSRLTFLGLHLRIDVSNVTGATGQNAQLVFMPDPQNSDALINEDITFRDCRFHLRNTSSSATWGADSAEGDQINIPEGDTDTGNTNTFKLTGLYLRGDYINDKPHKHISIESCRFEEMTARACWVWHCEDVHISNCSFQNLGARRPQIRCIVSNQNVKIDNNTFYDENPNGNTTWILLNRQAGLAYPGEHTISNNTFYYGSGICVDLDAVSNVAITGNTFKINPDYDTSRFSSTKQYRTQRAISVGNTTSTTGIIENISITGNTLSGGESGTRYPVTLVSSVSDNTYAPLRNVSITGNTVSDLGNSYDVQNGAVVISTTGLIVGFAMTGNAFHNCVRGISITNAINGIISGNNFSDTGYNDIGVSVYSEGVMGAVTISGNNFNGLSTGIYATSGSWPSNYLLFLSSPSGAFTSGETITGGTSSVTATAGTYNGLTFNQADYDASLPVTSPSGDFRVGETVTGGASTETATVVYWAPAEEQFVIVNNVFTNCNLGVRNFGSNDAINHNYMSNVTTALETTGGLATFTTTNQQEIF